MFIYLPSDPVVGLVTVFPKLTGVEYPFGKLQKWLDHMAGSNLPAEYQAVWLGVLWNMTGGERGPTLNEMELAKVAVVELDRFIKTGEVISEEVIELAKKLASS